MANTLVFANSSAVQARVEFQAVGLAKYVLQTEPDNTPNHATRVLLANLVLVGNSAALLGLTKLVLTNPSIIAASPTEEAFLTIVADGDILAELNACWTVMAKARFPS